MIDQEGIERLLEGARRLFARLSHLSLDTGYRGEDKGRGWVEKVLGWTVDLVERPRKSLPPEKVLRVWAAEWAKEGDEKWIGTSSYRHEGSRSCLAAG